MPRTVVSLNECATVSAVVVGPTTDRPMVDVVLAMPPGLGRAANEIRVSLESAADVDALEEVIAKARETFPRR